MKWIKDLKFKDKLIPAVVQDYKTGDVLMVAYMNEQAVEETVKTQKCTYYSRSRQKMWIKGETSGHIQKLKAIFVDCDMDCLLLKVEQIGGACHMGYRSCFYREAKPEGLKIIGEKVFEPDKVY